VEGVLARALLQSQSLQLRCCRGCTWAPLGQILLLAAAATGPASAGQPAGRASWHVKAAAQRVASLPIAKAVQQQARPKAASSSAVTAAAPHLLRPQQQRQAALQRPRTGPRRPAARRCCLAAVRPALLSGCSLRCCTRGGSLKSMKHSGRGARGSRWVCCFKGPPQLTCLCASCGVSRAVH
jgi:hypothetical protein